MKLWHNKGMTYSLEHRRHIFKIKKKEGLTFEETSKRFGISIRSLFRWEKRLEPSTTHFKPATKINMKALAQHVKKFPDQYQRERAEHFGVCKSAIGYALKRLGVTYKKNSATPKGERRRTHCLPGKNCKVQ